MKYKFWIKRLLKTLSPQKYTYKGNHYIVEHVAEMKDPDSREWIPCVIYVQVENKERYVREAEEFCKLFKPVK